MNEFLKVAPEWLPGVVVMGVLIIASGFFSGSETALFYLSREELRRMQAGRARERLAASLMRDPDRLLTVVLFWNLIINLSYFAVSLATAKRLVDLGQPTAAGILSALGLVGVIIFGEVGPKSVAVVFRTRVSVWASVPLAFAVRILDPLLPVLAATTAALRRMLYPQLKLEPYLEVDDIEKAVKTSELGVELVRLEQQILGRILELSDMTAEEVMRPRGTYQVWQPPIHQADLKRQTVLPEVLLIAADDRDSITHALSFYEVTSLPEQNLESIAEKIVYVPWCATVSDTLAKLRGSLLSVAGVVNEYGETVGVITEDDILDTLLDPQSSRGKRVLAREPVIIDSHGRVSADGLTTLRHLASRLKVDYDADDDAPLTIVALMHDELERFPGVGDVCEWNGFLLRVTQAGEPGDAIQVAVEKVSFSQRTEQ